MSALAHISCSLIQIDVDCYPRLIARHYGVTPDPRGNWGLFILDTNRRFSRAVANREIGVVPFSNSYETGSAKFAKYEGNRITVWPLHPSIVPNLRGCRENPGRTPSAGSSVLRSRAVCRSWCPACSGIGASCPKITTGTLWNEKGGGRATISDRPVQCLASGFRRIRNRIGSIWSLPKVTRLLHPA